MKYVALSAETNGGKPFEIFIFLTDISWQYWDSTICLITSTSFKSIVLLCIFVCVVDLMYGGIVFRVNQVKLSVPIVIMYT